MITEKLKVIVEELDQTFPKITEKGVDPYDTISSCLKSGNAKKMCQTIEQVTNESKICIA